jgi:hypothetical protein
MLKENVSELEREIVILQVDVIENQTKWRKLLKSLCESGYYQIRS